MKVVNTREYVDMLRGLTEEGKVVSMLIAGTSMTPFLGHQRDYIYFEKPKRDLKKGDMVFYQRDSGQYVMHRICKVHRIQRKGTDSKRDTMPQTGIASNLDTTHSTAPASTYDIVGDAQTLIEKNIRRDQIFALVVQVKRKGKIIGPGDFWWNFFEKVWINMIPFRRVVLACYTVFARIKG